MKTENNNNLYNKKLTNVDGLWLDYDKIHEGILRGKEDIRCGRYYDLETGMRILKERLDI